MARSRTHRASGVAFDAITVEGTLISPAMLARIARHEADGQKEPDYGIPKGLTLRDEIARYFRIGQALFAELSATPTPSLAVTIGFLEKLLRDVLGFSDVHRVGARALGGRQFAVALEALGGRVPVAVVSPSDDLDHPSAHLSSEGRKRSAASEIQDWVNAAQEAAWGFCSNGHSLRLVRDNASLTRPAYIEADLRHIFADEAFADFAALWLLIHASRFGVAGALPGDCALERWREAGQKEGLAARDKLRDGFEAALLSLGKGFLSHPGNGPLRDRLQSGALPLLELSGQLLRLVYRLIFLLVAEDRSLLHPPNAAAGPRKLYADGYSAGALRDRAVRRSAWDRHHDRWEGLRITFLGLARGEKRLGLPALGGLFAPGMMTDLEAAQISNRALMEAIFRLGWLREPSGLIPVNWRDMQTEELGSVYEGLLELTPQLTDGGRGLAFAQGGEAQGHARKTSGSYYTPDSLVQALLDSALDPVLDRVEAEADDPAALLSVTVLDPACGSGHFLLAAARRIATRLARLRADGVASASDFRHALRDVARACIHGVDRNPMAVELTKVALWIETVEPGKPLGFLDANIRCGDSLLGVFDLKALALGIPDASYKPLAGDDKEAAKIAGRINREQRDAAAQQELALDRGAVDLVKAARVVTDMSEDDLAAVQARATAYEAAHADRGWWATKTACDLYIAAFLAPKHFRAGALARVQTPDRVPTTLDVRAALAGRQPDAELVANAVDLAGTARALHWPLEFPAVIAAGGFDAVLGNPPWERFKLQEQEFFAARDSTIAEAPTAAARGQMIAKLKGAALGTRERALYEEFERAKRNAEASSVFARVPAAEGGRFALTGRGDVNTYALFAELFASVVSRRGRAGVIVPTGIATDATTAPFFAALVSEHRLASLIDFENRERLFPDVDSRVKFCLLTISREIKHSDFSFFLTDPPQAFEPNRRFILSANNIAQINPNTRTAPVFRSRADAELTAKIYANVPVLIDETRGLEGNPWNANFHTRIWHMAEDSAWFRTAAQLRGAGFDREGTDWITHKGVAPRQGALPLAGGRDTKSLDLHGGAPRVAADGRYVPLYEAKMIHQFDHRWATYDGNEVRELTDSEKKSVTFEPEPRYWVPEREVSDRLREQNWTQKWLFGWRETTNATNERTLIADIIPAFGCGHKFPLIFPDADPQLCAALCGSLNSLSCDFVARQKMGGTSFTLSVLKQLPVLGRSAYRDTDLNFIVPRVLELIYTSHSMTPFARALNYNGPPFIWHENRHAQVRAELDAWYARAYGLTRDELRYILDPADAKGPDYPSETFRVLKKNEIARFGEYRTAKLVLQAWDCHEELRKQKI